MKLHNIKTMLQNISQNFQYLNLFYQKPLFTTGKEILKLIASSCETNKYTSLSTLGVNGFSTFLTISIIYFSDIYST